MNERLATRIGKNAREARLEAKLTQADVAEQVGISPEVYGRLERGGMLPSVGTLLRVCVALEVSADLLLGISSGKEALVGELAPRLRESPAMRRALRTLRRLSGPDLRLIAMLGAALARK